ncbi:MAG: hypothetical protein WKF87_17840 [Chryseolinea sp.]
MQDNLISVPLSLAHLMFQRKSRIRLFRLYLWLKCHTSGKCRVEQIDYTELLSVTKRTFEKYLCQLDELGFVGYDKNACIIHLRNSNRVCKHYNVSGRTVGILPAKYLESYERFEAWLTALEQEQISRYHKRRSVNPRKFKRSKGKGQVAVNSQSPTKPRSNSLTSKPSQIKKPEFAGPPVIAGTSARYFAAKVRVSRNTAHRRLKNAKNQKTVTARQQWVVLDLYNHNQTKLLATPGQYDIAFVMEELPFLRGMIAMREQVTRVEDNAGGWNVTRESLPHVRHPDILETRVTIKRRRKLDRAKIGTIL